MSSDGLGNGFEFLDDLAQLVHPRFVLALGNAKGAGLLDVIVTPVRIGGSHFAPGFMQRVDGLGVALYQGLAAGAVEVNGGDGEFENGVSHCWVLSFHATFFRISRLSANRLLTCSFR